MEKSIKLTTCESGDWEILEINGERWASGHSITVHEWLDLLREHFGCAVERVCVSDEEMEMMC